MWVWLLSHYDPLVAVGCTDVGFCRYVVYLQQVIAGEALTPSQLTLKRVIISGAINYGGGKGKCKPFFKVYKENTNKYATDGPACARGLCRVLFDG